jgi:hypothetical protein
MAQTTQEIYNDKLASRLNADNAKVVRDISAVSGGTVKVEGVSGGFPLPVSLPAIPTGTNNIGSITNITGTVTLPTGASTSALQTTGNTTLSTISTAIATINTSTSAINTKLPASVGAKTAAASLSVTPATDAVFPQPTTQRTPTISVSSSTGTITAGSRSFSIANIGAASGTVGGVALQAGEVNTWVAPANDTLGSLAFDATGTTFKITEVR